MTFRIGARAYGMRTFATDSAEEELHEGSEYESVQLDDLLRADQDSYGDFARELLGVRISGWAGTMGADQLERSLSRRRKGDNWGPRSGGERRDSRDVERPHLSRLHDQLVDVTGSEDAMRIVDLLSYPESALMEKASIYALYQEFARGATDLVATAAEIDGQQRTATSDSSNPLYEIRKHFANDFRAQLLRARRSRRAEPPWELDELILMSEGLPRVFLTVMKHIFQWSEFETGELSVGTISAKARRRGLLDAARWFRDDIPHAGTARERIRLGILRIGELFRINRYADKPRECSLICFSTPNVGFSDVAEETIRESVYRSFLIQVSSGEKDRNSSQVRNKYQLNRLLCPLFELPIARRGTARFDARVTDAVFGTTDDALFNEVVRDWKRRLYWPFGRSTQDGRLDSATGQGSLF